MTATLIFLRLVFGGFSSLTLAESVNPLHDNDILQVSHVMNVFQCQRLCWYRKPCARYSFHTTNDNSKGSADNCVLHVTKGSNQRQVEGWILEEASSKGMPPDHGCLPRPCNETEICVPYNGRVNYQCIHAPSSEVDECTHSPCQNGGACVDKVKAYTCDCPSGFTGSNCEREIDECADSPCQNGGTCVDKVKAYTCDCPSGYTGSNCETGNWLDSNCSETCAWNMTKCYSGYCLCEAGYYFSHSKYVCVPTCTKLQNNYLRYRFFDLRGHDVGGQRTTHDVTECKSLCNAHSWCLVFVVKHGTTMCFLKNVTAQEYPLSWAKLNTVDTYQRMCE
ncbi:hypothetical protein V1264_008448 [Littorina saxatilis]|uniref:Uncharacterized protein n=1 Tax=Littorina saxatilis TaxID=31220 RepID=A0AAN9ATN6_9CAEN